MHRRSVLIALACSATTSVLPNDESPRPRHKIGAGELYKALSARFPVRFGLGALLELRISASRLLLLPARNQLGAALQAQLSGLQVPRPQAGEMDLVFNLRYESADQTVRAHRPEVLDMRWPGLPPQTAQALQGLLPSIAQQVGEVVLHKLSSRDLALADTMGFEPEELQVADDGLVILFGPKQRR